ncbi:phosphoribosyl-AMP cyclohydrolase [Alkalibacillus flavidus]|uniref:Phosphoribosyl-AMP cyclohydrolase n=1 Tax=Alkalibacillus flavidus TaxID=546021 RepID=A0ABV2KVX8_9BACI
MRIWFIAIIGFSLLVGCTNDGAHSQFTRELEGDQLTHVHGMGYEEKSGRLLFGTHHGLRIYEDDTWYETTDNIHDYMGFSVIDEGFYTSGHPNLQSDLPNPLGVQKSSDGGESLNEVDFLGETDFHYLAAGYESHDIFLYNSEANSKLEKGFYLSEDNGDTWEVIEAEQVKGELVKLAIHPTDSEQLAIATTQGIYLSKDRGGSFRLITDQGQGMSVHFTPDTLYYAAYQEGDDASLIAYDLDTGDMVAKSLPDLEGDAPKYIARNPDQPAEYAIYTHVNEAVYISQDNTESWEKLSESGRIQ